MRRLGARLLHIWAIAGALALAGFTVWAFIAYRATPAARSALTTDERVGVTRGRDHWRFTPSSGPAARIGLLFFPGAL